MKIRLPSITAFFAALDIGRRILDAISDKDFQGELLPLGEVLIMKQNGKRFYLDAKLVVR